MVMQNAVGVKELEEKEIVSKEIEQIEVPQEKQVVA
jgi:hypothetical protein